MPNGSLNNISFDEIPWNTGGIGGYSSPGQKPSTNRGGLRSPRMPNNPANPREPGQLRTRRPESFASYYQVQIPDWLRKLAEEGYGLDYIRSALKLQGTPVAEQTLAARRKLLEQGYLQGATATGFSTDRIRQIELEKGKALEKLRLGIRSQNEEVKRKALAQLKDLELFNKQVARDIKNMNEQEKLAALMRQWQYQQALKIQEAQNPSTLTQLGSLGLSIGPGLLALGGAATPFGWAALGLGGLFSLLG